MHIPSVHSAYTGTQSRFTEAERKTTVKTPPSLPLNLREKLGLKDAPSLEWLRDLSPEEEPFLGEVDQDVTDDLTQVHSTDHLFKPESRREAAKYGNHSPMVQPSLQPYDCLSRVTTVTCLPCVFPHRQRGP